MPYTGMPHASEMPYAGGMPRPDLDRFGDLIDDRIAELLDELLEEREAEAPRPRPRLRSALVMLLVALAASVVFRESVLAVCAIWLSTAVVYLAATWAGLRRS
jgi:hypothetical protein